MNGVCVKDLRILHPRPLSSIIIVDNATHSFGFQLDNGVPIISWYNNPHDTELANLIEYLKLLQQADDIREVNKTTFHLHDFYDDYLSEIINQANPGVASN